MSDEYDAVSTKKLKLKSDCELKKKKKKKKTKEKEKEKIARMMEQTQATSSRQPDSAESARIGSRPLTKAEVAFKQQQEKMKTKRILEKASMTHKQRVEKFNEHLDSLTEHFDIPKVSWTK